MRTIAELAKEKGRVYVFLSNDEIGNRFLKMAEDEGFTFGDGVKPTDPSRGYEIIMAVNHNKTLSYVGTNGRIAFGSGAPTVNNEKLIRVDFERYICNKNYIYRLRS